MFPKRSNHRPSLSRTVVALIYAIVSTLTNLPRSSAQIAHAPGRARKSEVRGALPLTPFYDNPNPFVAGQPGTLIRSEEFDDYDLSADMSALRILYHSRDAAAKDVAVSGVVLIPLGSPPKGGWPVIAWAHSFSGIARRCAPSLMRNIYNGPFLSMYLTLGYAIVATDYAGLGTGSRYAALDAQSNAMDVIYSVTAARAAVPQLGAKWIAMGSSQGAMAALAVRQLEAGTHDANYLGTVAISGVANAKDLYSGLGSRTWNNLLAAMVYGIQTVFPEFKPSSILTARGLAAYQQIGASCDVVGTDTGVQAAEMLKPDWQKDTLVQQFFSRNPAGQNPAHDPLLIIIGDADPLVPASLTTHVVEEMCKQHERVEFHEYPNLDAGGVLATSVRDQIEWIQARFAGRPANSNCP